MSPIVIWWAGLTMEEVFLVTYGCIIVPPMLALAVWAIIWHRKQKREAKRRAERPWAAPYEEGDGGTWIDTGYKPTGVPAITPMIEIRGCRCYDGETLIYDYEPCKNAEGVDGMYDHIAGEFIDRESFVKMLCEHLKRADNITVRSDWLDSDR